MFWKSGYLHEKDLNYPQADNFTQWSCHIHKFMSDKIFCFGFPKRLGVHNYSVGSYEGRDHLSIYLWGFQGDGAHTEIGDREFSGTT